MTEKIKALWFQGFKEKDIADRLEIDIDDVKRVVRPENRQNMRVIADFIHGINFDQNYRRACSNQFA
jgi:hypothetical protein